MRTATNPRHQPIRYDRYIEIHETVINRYYASGFIGEDTLEFNVLKRGVIELKGEIACLGNILIDVHKILILQSGNSNVRSDLVHTSHYSYNASVRGFGSIFLYDNAHPHHLHP